ncbi:hypothetical protein DK867_19370 [Ochrobactrum sp. POC9]|uniref:hypothetical protein n=1 Tax=unclassified Ochrobactrum TaxID=239106 RepID=UPI000D708AED|nr:hypothetical protein [Ochrobactrum sp. POC9]MCH4541296.1 hypothetical protein [Ochrobactrum sp. A-1]PWU71471.1 hypothetical protein DK867_19370 [Ochrobactrum sp. POC9]
MRSTFPDFATVLKEVEADTGQADDIRGPQFGFASTVFSAEFSDTPTTGRQPDGLQRLFDIESPPETAPAPDRERLAIEARMQKQSPDAIRQELDLQPGLKRAELQRRRRSFAASNHPDRLPEEFRPAAEQRMKTANALLDNAMASAPS